MGFSQLASYRCSITSTMSCFSHNHMPVKSKGLICDSALQMTSFSVNSQKESCVTVPYSSAPAPRVQRLSTMLGPTSGEVVADPMCWGQSVLLLLRFVPSFI